MKWTFFVAVSLLCSIFVGQANAGCRFNNASVVGRYGGFDFYRGLIYQKDKMTGKQLSAYAGVHAKNIGYCALVCGSKRACRAVTWRSGVPNNCLLFAGYDFVSKRPMSLHIYNGGGRARSAIIRNRYQGRLCR